MLHNQLMETSWIASPDRPSDEWMTPWPGAAVVVKQSTSSTMSDAWELAQAGCPTGTVAAALFQAQGRGRVPGRTWQAAAGSSLLATVVLRVSDLGWPVAELPLRAGVAAARGVQDVAAISVQVKWPNDLVWSASAGAPAKKLAGLLCEARADVALVGIGVNCTQESFPAEMESRACSLLQACGRRIAPARVLAAILRRLHDGEADWRRELSSRLYRRGQQVRLDLLGSGSSVEGRLLDVDERGRLLLELPDGSRRAVSQGELLSSP